MPTCFVMQPFDGAAFDERFEDVFAPAIRAAGFEPYRVDQDPEASIPIQAIESGIKEARICLAEISLDNPNVWFELGYAIACGKEVVLVCSTQRKTRFPFDVQHRSIITYSTESPRDFVELQGKITERIKAYVKKSEAITSAAEITKLTTFEGLDQYEVVALAVIAQNMSSPDDHVSAWQMRRDMEASGFTALAATLSMKQLLQKGFIFQDKFFDEHSDEAYTGYSLTDSGWSWVFANKSRFVLEKPKDDEIPF